MDYEVNTPSGSNARGKRVLPSRIRRGGPGVGTCAEDRMILEHLKRQSEYEPLIPADTTFIIASDLDDISAVVDISEKEPGLKVNIIALAKYFDKPAVIKAYREQSEIEVPEIIPLEETSHVATRTRPKAGAENVPSEHTSDEQCERAHRKYLTFEKRGKNHEKEKLKHDQYKLSQRIEQLRIMDASAFMTLPSDSFTVPSGSNEDDEAERRKEEMLAGAAALEERYRLLLPPDRPYKKPTQVRINGSTEPQLQPEPSRSSLSRMIRKPSALAEGITHPEPPPLSEEKLPAALRLELETPLSISAPLPPPRKRGRPRKRPLTPEKVLTTITAPVVKLPTPPLPPLPLPSPAPRAEPDEDRMSQPPIEILEHAGPESEEEGDDYQQSISTGPRRKRQKKSSVRRKAGSVVPAVGPTASAITSTSTFPRHPPAGGTPCIIIAATRTAGVREPRNYAFGVKVPLQAGKTAAPHTSGVEEVDFRIPDWYIPDLGQHLVDRLEKKGFVF